MSANFREYINKQTNNRYIICIRIYYICNCQKAVYVFWLVTFVVASPIYNTHSGWDSPRNLSITNRLYEHDERLTYLADWHVPQAKAGHNVVGDQDTWVKLKKKMAHQTTVQQRKKRWCTVAMNYLGEFEEFYAWAIQNVMTGSYTRSQGDWVRLVKKNGRKKNGKIKRTNHSLNWSHWRPNRESSILGSLKGYDVCKCSSKVKYYHQLIKADKGESTARSCPGTSVSRNFERLLASSFIWLLRRWMDRWREFDGSTSLLPSNHF